MRSKNTMTSRTSSRTRISTTRRWRLSRKRDAFYFSVRVLGIDCGTERTGYGVIESDGAHHSMIRGRCDQDGGQTSVERDRLMSIAVELRAVIERYSPDCVAVEDVFHAVNARSALKLAHVRGVALLLVAESRLPLGEYSPMEVKMSVVGYGRAEKAQVQMMVRSLLSLDQELPEDASDAVAVAICHATARPPPLRDWERRDEGCDRSPHRRSPVCRRLDPKVLYTKSFPGSVPAYVSVELLKNGQAIYKEAPDDENPVDFKVVARRYERDLRSGRQVGSLQAAARIEPEGRQHGHEDLSFRRRNREKRSKVQLLAR